MTATTFLAAAQRYRSLGFSVIPFRHRGKSPDPEALAASGNFLHPGQPSWEVFNTRPPTDAELNVWFAASERNVGLVSGFDELLILDFDHADIWTEWIGRYNHVATRTSVQRTGKGYHVLLRWKDAWSVQLYPNTRFQTLNAKGIIAGELKGAHDCAVAWPSIHENGRMYEWLPGQAPWETEIARIGSLREIGIEPMKSLLGAYSGVILKLIAHPGKKIPMYSRWLRKKYSFRRGTVFHNK